VKKRLKVVTIGGGTRDIYLRYQGADCMKITGAIGERNFMLFESGAKIEVENILYHTGGGATNSSVSFCRLGFDATCFCSLGKDAAGEAVVEELKAEGVGTDCVSISDKSSTGTSFVVHSLRGERTIFAYRGANRFLTEKDISLEDLKAADQLYVTSLSYEAANILGSVAKFAKENGVPIAVNPGISQLSAGVDELKKSLEFIDIFILNLDEAKTFMTALKGRYFSVPHFFKKVFSMGPKIVAVTDGARGVHVAYENRIFFHPALELDIVDTLGAGDAFGSCFVGLLKMGKSVEEALRGGIINSASVIGQVGAKPGLLTIEKLEEQMKKISPDLIQSCDL